MIKVVHPLNLGWLEKKLSDQEMDYLWRCIGNKKGDHRSNLAGNVSGSYLLMDRGDWFWLNSLNPLCATYQKEFDNNLGDSVAVSGKHPYFLGSWWVNYQNQHEFNPLHKHGGVYSFVIWMKIPTHYKDQQRLPISSNSNNDSVSNFEFVYTDICGKIMNWDYEMCPELEGTLVFFPSDLNHQVYPFYNCSEERVSISGNIMLNTAKLL